MCVFPSPRLRAPDRNRLVSQCVDAGSLSFDEMSTALDDGQVLAGVIRLGFGTGRFRRTKLIAVWWMGDAVPGRERGQSAG